ncbi:recombinase family protein [Hymenobacter endophyticus]|uniref:Recombinase family protein n=1 Tax=Hymenobacter endophyticus TaxID=3076335 RepID=A0ABU3TL60_9BACT|nr:recombinase family protein [Hymenobacter endophyticus]MDU0372121.1 recombinase family protein [Hymenobacter endophyticus]
MIFGYARVSAKDQNLDTQYEQLKAAGCDQVFQEKISGTKSSRPMLDLMVEGLRPGDTVMVARLNRLGRSTRHVLELIARFAELQVRFVSLDLGVDTATPAGKMMVGVFAVLAEYDREINRERQDHGRELAKAAGTHMGRRAGLDPKRLEQVSMAMKSGHTSAGAITKLTGLPLATVKRYKKVVESKD